MVINTSVKDYVYDNKLYTLYFSWSSVSYLFDYEKQLELFIKVDSTQSMNGAYKSKLWYYYDN